MTSAAAAGKPVGWSSAEDWSAMTDLLATYDETMTRKPAVTEVMTNDFLTP